MALQPISKVAAATLTVCPGAASLSHACVPAALPPAGGLFAAPPVASLISPPEPDVLLSELWPQAVANSRALLYRNAAVRREGGGEDEKRVQANVAALAMAGRSTQRACHRPTPRASATPTALPWRFARGSPIRVRG